MRGMQAWHLAALRGLLLGAILVVVLALALGAGVLTAELSQAGPLLG